MLSGCKVTTFYETDKFLKTKFQATSSFEMAWNRNVSANDIYFL